MYLRGVCLPVTTPAPSSDAGAGIRVAERADLLAVYRIEQSAFPQPWPFSAFEQYLGAPGFLVAADDSVVGYVVADTVHSHGRRMGHIKDLAVHEDHRENGIGTELLTRGVGVLEGDGVGAVKLEVRESNEVARELYRSHGFEHRSTVSNYYSDGESALVLVQDI
jgi:ribosomal-protein-alanine N-acetyltransferase